MINEELFYYFRNKDGNAQNELRLGNYLMYRGETLTRVQSLGVNGFETGKVSDTILDGIACGSTDIADYEPIPLTPEWLERMGFVKNRIGDYGIGNTFVFPYTNPGEWFVTFSPDKGGTAVRYVHQLQNIYYAMIGKELEIKEPA